MASSLAAQLAQIAVNSKSSLDAKTLKASHSKSLIFEPRVAAGQTFAGIFQICREGFDELCRLDSRFIPFGSTLFSDQSQEVNRTQLSSVDNAALDKRIESFLHLSGSRLRLMPAVKAIEWLIRRFRYVFWTGYLPAMALIKYKESTSSIQLLSSPLSCRTIPYRLS